jgi:hypothetical protein
VQPLACQVPTQPSTLTPSASAGRAVANARSGSASTAPASIVDREARSALAQAKVNTALSLARVAFRRVDVARYDWRQLPRSANALTGVQRDATSVSRERARQMPAYLPCFGTAALPRIKLDTRHQGSSAPDYNRLRQPPALPAALLQLGNCVVGLRIAETEIADEFPVRGN